MEIELDIIMEAKGRENFKEGEVKIEAKKIQLGVTIRKTQGTLGYLGPT